jgi:putative ABC transport system permease protein
MEHGTRNKKHFRTFIQSEATDNTPSVERFRAEEKQIKVRAFPIFVILALQNNDYLIPPIILPLNASLMFRNYLVSALRFLKHNKTFAGINLAGLSIALAASFIILLYVINEFSFNHSHKNRKDIYRVLNYYSEFKQVMAGTPFVLATALKNDFPAVSKAVNIRPVTVLLKLKEDIIPVISLGTQSDIFGIFTIPLAGGQTGETILDDMNSIVFSADLAGRLFPGEDPAGKEITAVINGKETMLVVKGVYEDLPLNSTLRPQCLVNGKWTLDPINKTFNATNAEVNWSFDFWQTWILLASGTEPGDIEKQFRDFEKKYMSGDEGRNYSLQNLDDLYLHSENVANTGMQGNLKNVRLFSLIALLILIVAAVNYIILSTAVSSARAKEIGIRKTFGAGNGRIGKQLLTESVIHVLLVLPVALILAKISLPVAGKLFETTLNIIPANVPVYIIIYILVTLLIGVLSGLYTSSFLSRLEVMKILRNTIQTGRRRQTIRSALIVLQLIIFCTFVSCALIIRSQYYFALRKDPGYYTKDILIIDLGRNFTGYSAFINNIKSNPNVIQAAGVMEGLPMQGSMSSMYPNFEDPSVKVKVEGMAVDYNFVNAMGIKIVEGREFSPDYGSDLTQSVMLNEKAVKELGITDPVGKKLGNQTIIGVVKDFNLHSFRTDIPPMTIDMTDKYIHQVVIQYSPGSLPGLLPFFESEWKKTAPDRPFTYETIESFIGSIYSSEKNLTTIISVFALFTLIIAAMGLFGLVLFTSRSRTKEIGIRKVFGSSGKKIIYSFLGSNLLLVLVSSAVSVPLTCYYMNRWLQNFAYHTVPAWWVFFVSLAVATVVVLATVYFHAYRASRTNPVNALRYE